jgi:hypothetical protein
MHLEAHLHFENAQSQQKNANGLPSQRLKPCETARRCKINFRR